MGRVVGTARVDGRGRIYIPPELRKRLQIKEGEFVVFREQRGEVFVEKLV